MNRISRRAFGGLMASGASLAVLASTTPFAFADSRLRLIWWGNPDRDKRTNEVADLYQTDQCRRDHRPRDLCVERLLAEARDAGRRAEPARRHPDGLPLHLRIRAARPARRSHALRRQADRPRRFRCEPARIRQGGRQALRHLFGRELVHARLSEADPRPAWRDAARSDEVDDRRLRRARQGGQGQASRRRLLLAEHGLRRAAARSHGCASAARSFTPPTGSSLTTSRT